MREKETKNVKKMIFIVVLFMGFTGPSYAFSVKEGLNSLKRGVQLCKEGFLKKERAGKYRVRHLIQRLDQALKNEEERLREEAPSLLKELHEFRAKTEALLSHEVSVSDSFNIQKELEGLVLPLAFWGTTVDMEVLGKKTFVSLRDSEKDFKESLQEWGEARLGRELSETEVKALEDTYHYFQLYPKRFYEYYHQGIYRRALISDISWDMMMAERYFLKQNILKEAGFSEEEIKGLGLKKVLRGNGSIELKIPQRTQEEARLKDKGFNTAYTRGMDEWNEWIAVAEQLREKKINAYATHIPYLAKKLREYMAYMEKGIQTPEQREQFELLRAYIELIIKERGVTYLQFLAVSLRMPDILSNEERPGGSHPFVVQIRAAAFPQEIAIPTTIGELGFIPFNKGEGLGIVPIALVTGDRIVDGITRNPISVSYHDEDHMETKGGTEKRFHEELMRRKEHLPFEQRRNIELAYHILTFEIIYEEGTFLNNRKEMEESIKTGLHNLIREDEQNPRGLRGVIDLSGYSDPYIQVVIDDFKRIFTEIQKREDSQLL